MPRPPANDDPTRSQVVPALAAGRRLLLAWPDGSSTHDLPLEGTFVVGRSNTLAHAAAKQVAAVRELRLD